MKLTTAINRLIVRCEEEINAARMGEPTANPQQAFDELVAAIDAARVPSPSDSRTNNE